MEIDDIILGIAGPCASGKTTLIKGLEQHGYHGKHIAQEHSYVPYMWKRLTNPDFLIFLDVSYKNTKNRKRLRWSEKEYLVQVKRLEHARRNADIIIYTDNLSPDEVLQKVISFINIQS